MTDDKKITYAELMTIVFYPLREACKRASLLPGEPNSQAAHSISACIETIRQSMPGAFPKPTPQEGKSVRFFVAASESVASPGDTNSTAAPSPSYTR